MNIVFARTRYEYDSYRDRNELIRLSGFPLKYIDEIDYQQSDQVVIVSPANGEIENIPLPEQRQSVVVHWDLERPRPDQTADRTRFDDVWVSDPALARSYNARYVFLGGHRAFGSTDFLHRDTHIITLAANFGRRTETLAKLRSEFTCADDPNGTWGVARDKALKRSQVMVNIHQDESLWHEPFRFLIAASYCLPLVTENCADTGYFKDGEHYLAGQLSDLPALVRAIVRYPQSWYRMAAACWRLVCIDRPFRYEVEAAVRDMMREFA